MSKYSIQEFSKITKVSKETLRYYESIDLLHPTRKENGYREYGANNIREIKIITMLKLIDTPLDEMVEIIKNREQLNLNLSLEFLSQKQNNLKEHIHRLIQIEELLDSSIQKMKTIKVEGNCIQIDTIIDEALDIIQK